MSHLNENFGQSQYQSPKQDQSTALGSVRSKQRWGDWFSPWPWMFCGSCLQTANSVHQYGRALLSQWHPSKDRIQAEGACLCPGVILYVTCPGLQSMRNSVSEPIRTSVSACVYMCEFEESERLLEITCSKGSRRLDREVFVSVEPTIKMLLLVHWRCKQRQRLIYAEGFDYLKNTIHSSSRQKVSKESPWKLQRSNRRAGFRVN